MFCPGIPSHAPNQIARLKLSTVPMTFIRHPFFAPVLGCTCGRCQVGDSNTEDYEREAQDFVGSVSFMQQKPGAEEGETGFESQDDDEHMAETGLPQRLRLQVDGRRQRDGPGRPRCHYRSHPNAS